MISTSEPSKLSTILKNSSGMSVEHCADFGIWNFINFRHVILLKSSILLSNNYYAVTVVTSFLFTGLNKDVPNEVWATIYPIEKYIKLEPQLNPELRPPAARSSPANGNAVYNFRHIPKETPRALAKLAILTVAIYYIARPCL